MGGQFQSFIEQVPKNVYTDAKAILGENIAIFKPNSFIINKKMCSEDYSFILPSSDLPPASIGRREVLLHKESLIAIGSAVEFMCTTYSPTKEYVNIIIKKDFFEDMASYITGKRNIDFSKIEYFRSRQLLKILYDLENEMIFYNGECQLMVESLCTQLIVQILRDAGIYQKKFAPPTCSSVSDLNKYINPNNYSILYYYNSFLPNSSKLTPREIEISVYLIENFDYDEIAGFLFISRNTLKTHAKNIYKKLNVSGRKELNSKIMQMIF